MSVPEQPRVHAWSSDAVDRAGLRLARQISSRIWAGAVLPSGGLPEFLMELQEKWLTDAIGLVVQSDTACFELRESIPSSPPRDNRDSNIVNSVKNILGQADVQKLLTHHSKKRTGYIRCERTSANKTTPLIHEVFLVRLPILGFLHNARPAFLCIVNRTLLRSAMEQESLHSARNLARVIAFAFRHLEAYILGIEHLAVLIERDPGALSSHDEPAVEGFNIDPGLGFSDTSAVTESAPWMELSHVARLYRVLLGSHVQAKRDHRALIESGWKAGFETRKILGIDSQVRSHEAALQAVLDWSEHLSHDAKVFAALRREENFPFKDGLTEKLVEVAASAQAELDPEKQLGEHALSLHLLANLANMPESRLNYWKSSAPSDEEFRIALSNIARLVHHTIGHVPIDRKTVQAYIWAVSEYAHHSLGLPEKFDLRAHLGVAEREEPALHGLRRFYRNHFFHVMEVCLLGHFLLDVVIDGTPLWEKVAGYLPSGPTTREQVLQVWYLTALLHDIGYAVDIAKGTIELFQMFGKDEVLGGLAKGFQRTIDEASDLLAKGEGFQQYERSDAPAEDHGVLGAWHLQTLLRKIKENDERFEIDRFSPAVRAIALHNSNKHQIAFKDDPLAFLLVLCDTLQEWNRPAMHFASVGSEVGAWLMSPDTPHIRMHHSMHDAILQGLKRSENGDKYEAGASGLQFEIRYSTEILHNWGVYNLWLSCTSGLQRLNPDGLGCSISVGFKTPCPKHKDSENKTTSMHELRDAARETHMHFLEKWFPNQPVDDGEAVNEFMRYIADGSHETLTLHLKELYNAHPLTEGMKAFRDAMKRWRRRDSGWVFEDDYGLDGLI